MAVSGKGSNFNEALDRFLENSTMCDSNAVKDLKHSLESSSNVSPLYVGINVKHSVNETFDYIKLFNKLNNDYLELFLPFLEKSGFHDQHFSVTKNLTSTSSLNDCKQVQNVNNGKPLNNEHTVKVLSVLGDSEEIVLQDHFHITLFFLGVDKKTPDMIQQDVEKVSKYLKDRSSDFKQMLNTLTLHEFSVCLMYRHLYKMPLPFETSEFPEFSEENAELGTMRYLVLVPGVVFFAIVELKKPLFAIPPKDFEAKPEHLKSLSSDPSHVPYDLEELFKKLKETVLIENFHSTHITLGTSKTYKAVISNQICQSLAHFLDNYDTSNVSLHSDLKYGSNTLKSHSCSGLSPTNEDLKKHLKVFNSGPCKYDNLKEVFLSSVPYLLDSFCGSNEDFNETVVLKDDPQFPNNAKQLRQESKDVYSKTCLYVSDDYKWFYFNNLPATHTLHSESSHETYDWFVDVYVVSFDKQVSGNIHFNQR
ncbi:hypothetical protein TpMuguga_04g00353 [Theileria parva strain Muguga]|uniref:Uncharacterized protein n=1 Tax=Theileria parva TaxID=5875 RepID=Q4N2J6_THEPA|nr:uncharacterized protein TpMuguga_04g00353 [Theileria parva strain Muguga]EAN31705.1 hypothetical protein TpMuguga_04g00353 [Theileria parva strain Muguga]|eukprot:XP_763988.1 hypothetical protein [Theileria parva strain Muguga]